MPSLVGEPPATSAEDRKVSIHALLANGFRPFFLAAALLATVAVPIWLLALNAAASVGGRYLEPMAWHSHEMVFGYASAVVAGFLLTAVRNWTSRPTATGGSLGALVVLWALGRAVLLGSSVLPPLLVALVDIAFLPAVALVIARPIVASGSRRNYVMVAILGLLTAANVSVHLDALGVLPRWQLRGTHAGVDVIVLLAAIIGGRVIPMFTRNSTGSKSVVSSKPLDLAALAALAVYGALDVALPQSSVTSLVAFVAAVLIIARAARWGTIAALRQPLLWILHLGHAWIAVGLALRAATAIAPSIPASAATHALTVGAIGSLTLGMMVRVSLGHTGRKLAARPIAVLAFALLTLAVLARVFGPIATRGGGSYFRWLLLSGTAWSLAFALFVVAYAPVLARPRVDGKPG